MSNNEANFLEQGSRTGQIYGWAFYLCCFAFIYLHVFLLPATPIYYEADHINLLNDAKRMTEGQFIYRDFFEFLLPGAHTLFAGLMLLFGPKYWLVSVVILLHGMAAAWLGVQISRRVIGETAAAYLPSAIFLFFGFRWFGVDGEHRMLSPIFAYAAILVLLGGRSTGRLVAAGIACAATSFFTQQRGVLTALAILIYLLIEFGFIDNKWREFLRSSVIFCSVCVVSLLVMLLPFIVVAGWDRFYEDTLLFLVSYAQDPATNSLATYLSTLLKIRSFGNLMTVITLFYSFLIPLIYLIVLGLVYFRRREMSGVRDRGIVLVCLVGLLLAVGTSGPNVFRLFQVSLPAVIALVWLLSRLWLAVPKVAAAAAISLAVFGLVLGVRLQTAWDMNVLQTRSGTLAFPSPVIAERYEWLLANADSGDKVYEVYNSHVNFPLGLPNPSRMSILLNTGYSPPQHVAWAITDLKRENPRYIIWDGAWTKEVEQQEPGDRLRPLYDYLLANYRQVHTFTPYDGREMQMWERVNADVGRASE